MCAMRLSGSIFLPFAAATFAGFLLAGCSTTADSSATTASTSLADSGPAPTQLPQTQLPPTQPAPTQVAAASPPARTGFFSGLFGPKDPNAGVITLPDGNIITPDMLLKQGYCPPVQIRAGTESFIVYERQHEDDPAYARFQASLGKTARECHPTPAGDGLTVKLGVTGRLIAGPKGGQGTASLPLRVAVVKQHGGTVLFTKAYKVPVTVRAPQYFGDFAQVIDDIAFKVGPDDRDLVIYVGYDEGKPKPKTPPDLGY
jgi:hypothetical protein